MKIGFIGLGNVGADLATAYEEIRISSGNSIVHETEGQLTLDGSYNTDFTMDHEPEEPGGEVEVGRPG